MRKRSTNSASGSGFRNVAGPAGHDERRAGPRRAAEREAGERQAVEHVHVVGLERDREGDDVEVAERAILLERAEVSDAHRARDVGQEGAIDGDARIVGQQAKHRLEPQVRHADRVAVRVDEADRERPARPGREQATLGGEKLESVGGGPRHIAAAGSHTPRLPPPQGAVPGR